MPQISVELTESEYLAMTHVAVSVQEWVDSAVKNRAHAASQQIVRVATEMCFATNTQVPATKEELIALAFERGWVKTLLQQNEEAVAAYQAMIAAAEAAQPQE